MKVAVDAIEGKWAPCALPRAGKTKRPEILAGFFAGGRAVKWAA